MSSQRFSYLWPVAAMKSLTLALLLVLGATLAQGRHGGHHHGHLRAYQLICSIESTTDEVIVMPHGFPQPNGQCPGDSSCTIGPFTANFEGRELQVTLCDALDSDGNLLVVSYLNNTIFIVRNKPDRSLFAVQMGLPHWAGWWNSHWENSSWDCDSWPMHSGSPDWIQVQRTGCYRLLPSKTSPPTPASWSRCRWNIWGLGWWNWNLRGLGWNI